MICVAHTILNDVELTQLPSVGQTGNDSGTAAAAADTEETPAKDASKPAATAIASVRVAGFKGYNTQENRAI